ncbi:MAG: acyltransferase family protein [Paludibacteraceae bacterium]|nr:acyltransferase family protein [Paludibacteraceae bacterium]
MSSTNNTNRDNTIDIAKAIGIIFVVIGHCCAIPRHGGDVQWQIYISDYIYTFHMPLFFLLSGYFFSKHNLDNKLNFVKKKITGLWSPYVKWTLVFTLLHNTLLNIGMYGSFKDSFPITYDTYDLIKRTIATLFFLGGDQLIGGFWFIPTLFYASIYSLFVMWFFRFFVNKLPNINKEHLYNILVVVCISIFFLISVITTQFSLSIPKIGITNKTFLASSIFLTGHLISILNQKYKDNIKKTTDIILICLGTIISILITIYKPADFNNISDWYDIIYIWFAGSIGTWTWVLISKFLAKWSSPIISVLVYIGKNTMIILALHFSCFKIVNLMKIYYYNLDNVPYGSFPILANDPSANNVFWWILYIIVGVFIPIAIKWYYDKFKLTIKQKNLH